MPLQRDADYFQVWRKALRTLGKPVWSSRSRASACATMPGPSIVPPVGDGLYRGVRGRAVVRHELARDRPVQLVWRRLDAYAEIVSDFSADEQRALFSDNANRIFRLT